MKRSYPTLSLKASKTDSQRWIRRSSPNFEAIKWYRRRKPRVLYGVCLAEASWRGFFSLRTRLGCQASDSRYRAKANCACVAVLGEFQGSTGGCGMARPLDRHGLKTERCYKLNGILQWSPSIPICYETTQKCIKEIGRNNEADWQALGLRGDWKMLKVVCWWNA